METIRPTDKGWRIAGRIYAVDLVTGIFQRYGIASPARSQIEHPLEVRAAENGQHRVVIKRVIEPGDVERASIDLLDRKASRRAQVPETCGEPALAMGRLNQRSQWIIRRQFDRR